MQVQKIMLVSWATHSLWHFEKRETYKQSRVTSSTEGKLGESGWIPKFPSAVATGISHGIPTIPMKWVPIRPIWIICIHSPNWTDWPSVIDTPIPFPSFPFSVATWGCYQIHRETLVTHNRLVMFSHHVIYGPGWRFFGAMALKCFEYSEKGGLNLQLILDSSNVGPPR